MAITFNYRKLRGRIVEICGSQQEFSRKMGMSERSISLKLNGQQSWKLRDIDKASKILEIAPEDIGIYFFAYEVQDA